MSNTSARTLQVLNVLHMAVSMQAEARRQNGGKRPPGFELMGWLEDAGMLMSKTLGIPYHVADKSVLDRPSKYKAIPVEAIPETIHNPVDVFSNGYILCLIIVDSDGKEYALRSTDISRNWDRFVDVVKSYERCHN